MSKGYHIVLEGIDGNKYKAAKIIFTKEGGFSLIPSHPNTNGLISKRIVEYSYKGKHNYPISMEDPIFNVNSNVKLTVHYDGFVQFSSVDQINKIVSGRMKYSRLAKGVGIKIHSLSTPINTGPTCGIIVWGITNYPIISSTKGKNFLYLPNDSFIYEGCNEDSFNAYSIKITVFKKSQFLKYTQEKNGKFFLFKKDSTYIYNPNIIIKYRIINNNKVDYLIAISGVKHTVNFKHESGFTLSGPSELIPSRFYPEEKGISLQAIFPSPLYNDPDIKTLDYLPEMTLQDYKL